VVDDERQFESEFEDMDLDRLSSDLKVLCQPGESVPPEVDRRIMDMANRRLRRRPVRQWVGWAATAAAAVILIFAYIFKPVPSFVRRYSKDVAANKTKAMEVIPADIDLNGQVNILDAFKLARRLESSQVMESQWDINGDGQIDRGDVETIAIVAVSLDQGVRL
jgi:hypothetical protein